MHIKYNRKFFIIRLWPQSLPILIKASFFLVLRSEIAIQIH